jgi:hypothetical protein
MALIRPNNKALSNITTLPSGITEYNLQETDLPSGTVLQVYNQHSSQAVAYSVTNANLFIATLTAKQTNSKFIVMTGISYGSPTASTNADSSDIKFVLARTINDGSRTVLEGNSNYNRSPGGLTENPWYLTDVPWSPNNSDTHAGAYDVFHRGMQYTDSPSANAGDTLKYHISMGCQGDFYFNRNRVHTAGGGSSFITVMEIAG